MRSGSMSRAESDAELCVAAAARARAEFAQWDAVLRRHGDEIALIDATDDPEISKEGRAGRDAA